MIALSPARFLILTGVPTKFLTRFGSVYPDATVINIVNPVPG
jgi:hypothetical protein